MAKPKWGAKRVCPSCSVRFYDLGRLPIVCPACESAFEADAFVRARRSKSSTPAEPPAPKKELAPAVAEKDESESDAAEDFPNVDVEVGDDDDDENPIEDASELSEDEDDVAEVVVKVDGDKES